MSLVKTKWLTDLFLAQQGRCFHCGCLMAIGPDQTPQKPPKNGDLPGWTKEHVMPKLNGNGAENGNMNVVLACRPCNQSKGDREPTADEFRRYHWLQRSIGKPTVFLKYVKKVA